MKGNDIQSDIIKRDLDSVCHLSPFVGNLLASHPGLAEASLRDVDTTLDRTSLISRYQQYLDESPADDMPGLLRGLRQQEMVRIIFRDLTRRAHLFETTAELSHLADFCVDQAIDHCYTGAVAKYGCPMTGGKPEKMAVLGMGKLGAYELNLSSDIDLIFFYENQGQLQLENDKTLSFQEFFLRLSRQVIACLDDAGSIDTVFRVDMRLRPYGDSGPLILHRAAMEKYYLEQGRDWERYAFIKARVIAGDIAVGEDFLDWMKPFIYRRHLDYSAIGSLREMKGLIARQVELKEMSSDLKLGPGGIREVEFVVQAHQLIWGGRYPELQEPQLALVLKQLGALSFLPDSDVEALREAYVFLRNSEHAVQAENDQQTHRVPDAEDSRERLATAMGFSSFALYEHRLNEHRAEVMRCFTELVAVKEEPGLRATSQWTAVWQHPTTQALQSLREDVIDMDLEDHVMDTIDTVMPQLLELCDGCDTAAGVSVVEDRMFPVIRAILRRSTYLVFLKENPDALSRAVELVGVSSWIAEQLEAYPILLYELTERALREVAATKLAIEGQLREVMRTVDAGDLEQQMDTLRQFKLAATIKIAAMELLGKLSIMQASDGLTSLAEVLLETSLDLAWQHLEAKHGLPSDAAGQPLDSKMAIIAYGKAGGLELAYGSDLDLVFICPDEIQATTDGRVPIHNNMFYVRLGQRVIHILTSFTRFGTLYEADMRLRPQGNKGPLVATLAAFKRYQDTEAWTWEHQALVRARMVAGDTAIGEAFQAIRQSVLQAHRDREALLNDVLIMREKMRAHLASPSADVQEEGMDVLTEFDLKHDAGAIVDIEFMVQYAVLGWAGEHPELSRWTDVMRLLDELSDAVVLTEAEVDSLQRAYLAFRAAVHHGWLGLDTDYERLQLYRADVQKIWSERMDKQRSGH